MKITIEKDTFLYAVSAVERAVSSKKTLPVLGGIRIKAAAGTVTFSATDLELAIQCVTGATITEEGEIVAPGRKLSAIARLLPEGEIVLTGSQSQLSICYGDSELNVLCLPAEEFPVLPEAEGEIQGKIPVRVFRKLVRQVGIAATSEEIRPIFTGLFTEIQADTVTMVATDTHRLTRGRGIWQGAGEGSLIIPNRTMQEIARLAVNEEDQILITAGKNQIYFSFANLTFTSRVILGQYPDYHQVIPADSAFIAEAVISKQRFLEALERAALISHESGRGKGSVVRLSLGNAMLVISAEAQDEGSIHEEIPVEAGGEELVVNYNARYLLDALKVIQEENIRLKLTGPSTPGVIVPESDEGAENYLYLLLPVRVSR